jgi:hypothetical protein
MLVGGTELPTQRFVVGSNYREPAARGTLPTKPYTYTVQVQPPASLVHQGCKLILLIITGHVDYLWVYEILVRSTRADLPYQIFGR